MSLTGVAFRSSRGISRRPQQIVFVKRWKTQFSAVYPAAVVAKQQTVEEILTRIKTRDGLSSYTPNIEYLVGGGQQGSWLDISDKTESILRSSHPIRQLVQREMMEMNAEVQPDLKYLDWVTLFGRSLTPSGQNRHEDQLANIARAAECGMFSSQVHQTVVNTSITYPFKQHADFHLGNKYAVLVGDFFAIKTIQFAAKVKRSDVFLKIINGVENFTYSNFTSQLIDRSFGYPILPCEGATVEQWMTHAIESSGYFTGGLNAAAVLMSTKENEQVVEFVGKLALCLQVKRDLNEFSEERVECVSPFVFTSLPAVIFQRERPHVFQQLRKFQFDVPLEELNEIKREIGKSAGVTEAEGFMREFATSGVQLIQSIGEDDFYVEAIQDLVGGFTV